MSGTAGFDRIAVVGGGAWGTALALVAARAGRDTRLVAREPETVAAINATAENPAYLPGIRLDPQLKATTDLAATTLADAVLLVVPAQATRAVAAGLRPVLRPGTPVVACAKGFEIGTHARMTEVIAAELPNARPAVLSGPSFAADVARGLPTAVTVAAAEPGLAEALARALSSSRFRPYASDDPVGAEIGGALKNVLAIACGIVVGRGLGASAQAALTARGFAELSRLGAAAGARTETLMGLSGLGDLVLTASSRQSRNFSLGIALGEGVPLGEATGGKLAEGAYTAAVALELAAARGVEVPITAAVADVLAGTLTVPDAIDRLMTRPLRREG